MGIVTGSIRIRDNATVVLRAIRSEQSRFRRDVENTRRNLTRTWERRYRARLEATAATRVIRQLQTRLNPLRRRLVMAIAIRDMASDKVKRVIGKIKSVAKMVAKPLIKLKDGASAGIGKIKGKIKGIAKKTVIPVTVAATIAAAALGGAVKGGMQLENQQVSMKHFIGATNKGMDESAVQQVADEFTSALRENANATPFETGDVISAGTRALSVSSGNTKEAMGLVTLAEDMAAASGGTKSISDAMEALADAKMGETERLKEFGFKVSAEEFDAKGFTGVSADLQDFFGGAAGKLAQTGSGLMSTIKGKLKSNFADFGLNIVNKMKPVLENVISIIDKSTPAMVQFGNNIADKIGKGIEFVSAIIPSMISGLSSMKPIFTTIIEGFRPMMPQLAAFGAGVLAAVQQLSTAALPVVSSIISTVQTVIPAVLPVLQTVITTISSIISQAAPIISGMVEGIGSVITTLAPVFSTIFSSIGEKVGSVIGFVGERMGFIKDIIGRAAPLIGSILTAAWGVISPILDISVGAFKILFSVVEHVFPGILSVVERVWESLKPIVEGIGKALSTVAEGWNWVVGKVTGEGKGKGKKPGANARGTNNWKGGLTWVGEDGAELVDLPKGTRILPHKESISVVNGVSGSSAKQSMGALGATTQNIRVVGGASDDASERSAVLSNIENYVSIIASYFTQGHAPERIEGRGSTRGEESLSVPNLPGNQPPITKEKNGKTVSISIAKLADSIIVKEEGDIEKIANAVAQKFTAVIVNMA